MKKLLAIALLFSSLFIFASCSDVQENAQTTTEQTTETTQTTEATTQFQNVTKEYYSNGNVKTLTVFDDDGKIVSAAKYNSLGYCISESLFDNKGREKLITTYEDFDENGVAMTQSIYDPIKATTVVNTLSKDGSYIERVTLYNENYLPVKAEYWSAEKELLKYELYDYYDNLNVKSIFYCKGEEKYAYVNYDKNGALLSSKEEGAPAKIYFYNKEGELEEIKEHIYSVGEIMQISKYSESGNLLYHLDYEIREFDAILKSRTDFNEDGKGFIKTVYEYRNDGSLSKASSYNEKDLLVKEETFYENVSNSKNIYHYNEKNLLVKEERYYKNELSYYYLFEHYESGNVSKIFYYFRHEYIDSVYTDKIFLDACWEFHENGNYFKETYYTNGIISYEAEYDEDGILIRDAAYYKNGLFSREAFYTNGERAKHIFYNEDGSVDYYIIYEDTRTVHYYPDGTPKAVIAAGRTTYYAPNGSVSYYVEGDKSYYANGSIRSETESIGYYDTMTKYYTIDGEYNGCFVREGNGSFITETTYDAEGNVISVKEYSTVQPS